MADLADEETKIRIAFTMSQGALEYRDALYFTPEQYGLLTQEEIRQMQEERFANWLAALEEARNAPVEEPTLEQLEQEAQSIQEQIDALQQRKVEIVEQQAVLEASQPIGVEENG